MDLWQTVADQETLAFAAAEFTAVPQLHHKTIGDTYFAADYVLDLRMPYYFIPFGSTNIGGTIGFYAHSDYVQQKKLPIAEMSEEGTLIEIAPSLQAYIHFLLTWQEAYAVEDGDDPIEEVAEELIWVNEIFGAGFYEAGQHSDDMDEFNTDIVSGYMIEKFGGSVKHFLEEARYSRTAAETVTQLKRGIAAYPHSFALHTALAKHYWHAGDQPAAVAACTQTAACYHHTEKLLDLNYLRQRAAELSPETQQALGFIPLAERVDLIVAAYEAQHVTLCIKLLDDLCYDLCTYHYQTIRTLLHQLYTKMGWHYLLTLNQFRPSEDVTAGIQRHRQLAPEWDAPLRQLLGDF